MAFKGWKAEALEFFDGLQAENTKAYWERHKTEYLELVRAPMEALLAELEAEFGEGKIFRPYRDIRFSADKTPYKDHIGATLGQGGYVQLSADGLAAGSGMWEMAPDRARALPRGRRGGPVRHRAGAARHCHAQRWGGPDVARGAEDGSARLSQGPPADRAPSVEGRGDVARVAARGVARHRAGERRIVGFFQASAPINAWLAAQVGPSTMPAERR